MTSIRLVTPIHVDVFVPQEQMIDTVRLYGLKGKRELSLKFLAKHVLKKEIQASMHDSIEDAMIALELYNHYKSIDNKKAYVKHLYDIGYECGFK